MLGMVGSYAAYFAGSLVFSYFATPAVEWIKNNLERGYPGSKPGNCINPWNAVVVMIPPMLTITKTAYSTMPMYATASLTGSLIGSILAKKRAAFVESLSHLPTVSTEAVGSQKAGATSSEEV